MNTFSSVISLFVVASLAGCSSESSDEAAGGREQLYDSLTQDEALVLCSPSGQLGESNRAFTQGANTRTSCNMIGLYRGSEKPTATEAQTACRDAYTTCMANVVERP